MGLTQNIFNSIELDEGFFGVYIGEISTCQKFEWINDKLSSKKGFAGIVSLTSKIYCKILSHIVAGRGHKASDRDFSLI